MLRTCALLLLLWWTPSLHADYVYQGTVYNPPTYNDTGKTCPYPIEATTALTCPRQLYADSQKGPAIVFMDDPEPPPNVLATISLLQFEGIDQALLTFTIRFNIFLAWDDARSYSQIKAATAAANRTGKCGKYCSKSTLIGSVADCCDGIWLPTLQFLGAKASTFVEEDFIIVSQGPEYPVKGDSNTTLYLIKASTTVNQDFDFSAFPFDQHALRLRILCMDCHLVSNPSNGPDATFATYRLKTSTDGEGTHYPAASI